MPLLVNCLELQPGMRLADAFMLRGRMMLPGGKVLTGEDVEILHRKYPEASFRVGDPVLDSLVQFEDDSRERTVATTARQKIVSCMSEVQERFASHADLGGLDYGRVKAAALDVIEYLRQHPVSAALLDQSLDQSNPLAEHSGNVFYLCMVLGSAVRDYVVRERVRQTSASNLSPAVSMDLLPLGLGAMLMDVGMYPVQHVFAENYALTDADRAAILEHPASGAELLPDTLPTGVKMVVRAHHENFDGTGYPKAQPGATLHVFPRIARVCDAYAAATSKRAYRGAKSPARAIWEMTAGPWRKCYDPTLAKVFAGLIQPFPVGAKLRLADGRYAVVVRYNRRSPLKPVVVVAFDEDGTRLPELQMVGPVPVGEDNDLRLASFGGEDLAYIYEDAPEPLQPPRTFATLIEAGYP